MARIRVHTRVNVGTARTDRAAVAAYIRSEPGIQRDLSRRGDRMMAGWRRDVPAGRLSSTFRQQPGATTGPGITCIAGVEGLTPYLGYYHDGTGPHEIRPRLKKVLRFVQNGAVVFRKRVRHPGFRGNPFLIRNIPLAGD